MTDLTLRRLFVHGLSLHGDAPAIHIRGSTYSYADIAVSANKLANHLVRAGAGPGVSVAIVMSNSVEYVIADQAIIRCGAVKVPINDMLSAGEIDYILRDSEAVIALTDEQMLPAVRASSARLNLVVSNGNTDDLPADVRAWSTALAGEDTWPPDVQDTPEDLGLIIYTGGTTGHPKGVLHTQRNLALNLVSHMIELGMQDDEIVLLSTPLPHSAGFLLLAGMLKGARHFIERSFDADTVLYRIAHDGVTCVFMVPTMIYRVLDRAESRDVGPHCLRTVLYGAAPITRERLEQGLDRFGPVFMQLYGQTEAPNFLTRLRREDHRLDPGHEHRLASCGRPVAMSAVKIVGEDGNEVPTGEAGEVLAHSPYTMIGYKDLPEATAKALRDGWLCTGDIGRVDEDGFLYLLDRRNDMIISGGMNVYSTEVENIVQSCPGVASVAVVGIPHSDWGEAVVAFVVPDGAENLNAETIFAHCRDRIARYKQPKAVRFTDSLPVTAYGKPDKKTLRTYQLDW